MIRAQIVLDEETAERLRAVSDRTEASMSEIVRKALVFWLDQREPDLAWIGSLKPKRKRSHDLEAIRASVVAGRKREPGR